MRFALPRRPSVRSWFPSPGLHSARRGGRTYGADEEWTDAAGTVELKRRRRNGVQEEKGRTEGRREGRFIHSQLVVSCVSHAGKAATRGDPIGRKGERTRGRRAVIPVCLFRLGAVPNPESQQDGEADGGDDRGPDEGVRHGQRQETQLLVSA